MAATNFEKRVVSILIASLLGLISLAGCMEDTPKSTASFDASTTTDATRALWDAGFRDPYLDIEPTGVVHEYDFYVDEFGIINPYGDEEFWASYYVTEPDTPGAAPGPEIRVKQGDTVRVTLHSPDSAFAGHTIHWHGIDLPWASDGVPFVTQDLAESGQDHSYTYEFVAKQAGTYWYHCVTGFPLDLELGMFGALIVEPADPTEDLPYDRDEVLFFHDIDSQYWQTLGWGLHDGIDPTSASPPSNPADAAEAAQHHARVVMDVVGGQASGATGESVVAEGPRDYYPITSVRYRPHYDLFMINGKSYPDTEPIIINEGETIRLRLVNAAQIHKSIHLHGHHVLVTHVDGYPLEHPIWEDTVSLAPGERKDVYVQGTNPGIWKMHDHSGVPGQGSTNANDYAFPGGQITAIAYADFDPPGFADRVRNADTAGDLVPFAPSGV